MPAIEKAKSLEAKGDFKGAFQSFAEAAAAGNAEAQFKVGFYYIFGMNATPLDPKKAVASLQQAVEQKYGPAYGLLAECLLMGIGTTRDPVAALKMAESKEAQDDPFAADVAANILFHGHAGKMDYQRAADLFERGRQGIAAAASKGDPRGQACYAGMLLGNQAQQQEHCNAYAALERIHEEAAGGGELEGKSEAKQPASSDKDKSSKSREDEEKEGVEWAIKAATQGFAAAQALLGEHYLNNGEVEKALEYATLAYEQGEVAAYHIMGALSVMGVEGKIEKSMEEAVKYWTQGVEKDDPGSAVALADYLAQQQGPETKRGPSGEQSRVAQLYEKAARQADPMGEYCWAATLLNGLYGEETDFKHGLMFLARAAENGHPTAREDLDELQAQIAEADAEEEEDPRVMAQHMTFLQMGATAPGKAERKQ